MGMIRSRSAQQAWGEVADDRYVALTPVETRVNDLAEALTDDLGGSQAISTAQLMLIKRAAMLALQLELLERHFLTRRDGDHGGAMQLQTYNMMANTLRRTLQALGLKRVPRAKDITPTLATYLRRKGRSVDAAPVSGDADEEAED